MCDPLSAVGSVLALAGFAGESCDHLCKYFRSYSEASEDIRHHISSLQALQTTFTSIAAIEKDLPKGFIIPPRFGARLQECASDLAATDKFIAFSQTRLQNRKIQRTWAKLRWASPDQKHKLQTMLGRIEAHHRNFSLDLLVLNIQLGLHPKDETKVCNFTGHGSSILQDIGQAQHMDYNDHRELSSSTGNPNSAACQQRLSSCRLQLSSGNTQHPCSSNRTYYNRNAGDFGREHSLPNDSGELLSYKEKHGMNHDMKTGTHCSYMEIISIQGNRIQCFRSKFATSLAWTGPLNVQQLKNGHSFSSETELKPTGFGIAIVLVPCWIAIVRLQLEIFLLKRRNGSQNNFSLQWSLSCSRILSWDDDFVSTFRAGNIERVKSFFSARKASPFDVLPSGYTLLHMACSDGQIEMVKLLINEGLNINEFNDAGQNPSHFALRFGSKDEICRLLMDRGAELDHRSIAGEQPFHTFHSSALEQTINRHRYLTDFWNPDWRGMTILHWMAWSSKSSGAFLESFGSQAKAQVSVADHDGRTMLHLAAQRGNIDVINYIFRAKPDFYVDFPDSTGRTPLFYATHSKRSPQTIRSLVARGANLWAEDCHGNTLFHAAAAQNNFEAVDTLVELGVGRLLWKRSGARELTAAEYASWQTRHALAGYLERLLLEQDEMIPETPIQQGCSSEALCDSCQDVERRTITTEQLDLKVSALGKLAYLLESVNHLCKFILKSCPSQNLLCASVLALIAWMICLSTR